MGHVLHHAGGKATVDVYLTAPGQPPRRGAPDQHSHAVMRNGTRVVLVGEPDRGMRCVRVPPDGALVWVKPKHLREIEAGGDGAAPGRRLLDLPGRCASAWDPATRDILCEVLGRSLSDADLKAAVREQAEYEANQVAEFLLSKESRIEQLVRELQEELSPNGEVAMAAIEAVVRDVLSAVPRPGQQAARAEMRRRVTAQIPPESPRSVSPPHPPHPDPPRPAGMHAAGPGKCRRLPGTAGTWLLTPRSLGCGSFGEVVLADLELPGGKVEEGYAIKIVMVDNGRWSREETLRRLNREAECLEKVRHPNVIRLMEHRLLPQTPESGPLFMFMMPCMRGGNLQEMLEQRAEQPLPMGMSREIFRQIAAGIRALHEAGIVSRDVKPANVLLSRHVDPAEQELREPLTVVHADLGLAARLDKHGVVQETKLGCAVGTWRYRAPETLDDPSEDDGLRNGGVDVWAEGVILYQFVTGRMPFGHATPVSFTKLREQIRNGIPPSPPPDPAPAGASAADREAQWDLVRSMLRVHLPARPTAAEVCAHQWLAGPAGSPPLAPSPAAAAAPAPEVAQHSDPAAGAAPET
eukprot:TRINITY_DN12294_c0_g1_i1.p1 TRINITY_DN12294_c0_g1~~TRINITY_DN12294_c0_g1_i1.p1  ORF type:complete len:580 (+),score=134.69 TRINITY_DN12294_c0_g1_i1:77-1816(+)